MTRGKRTASRRGALPARCIAGAGSWYAATSAGALAAALLAAAPLPEAAYLEGPPPARTGGFGGDTCHVCHFENDLDAPGGSLTIRGVPDTFDPSATYRITVSLERPAMARAGFQLAARVGAGDGDGGPAGALQVVAGDDRVQVVTAADGLAHAQHTEPGTALPRPGTASWTVEWRPPAAGAAAAVFSRGSERGQRRRLGVRRLHLHGVGVDAASRPLRATRRHPPPGLKTVPAPSPGTRPPRPATRIPPACALPCR